MTTTDPAAPAPPPPPPSAHAVKADAETPVSFELLRPWFGSTYSDDYVRGVAASLLSHGVHSAEVLRLLEISDLRDAGLDVGPARVLWAFCKKEQTRDKSGRPLFCCDDAAAIARSMEVYVEYVREHSTSEVVPKEDSARHRPNWCANHSVFPTLVERGATLDALEVYYLSRFSRSAAAELFGRPPAAQQIDNRSLNPLCLTAGARGTGKSRLLDEVQGEMARRFASSRDSELHKRHLAHLSREQRDEVVETSGHYLERFHAGWELLMQLLAEPGQKETLHQHYRALPLCSTGMEHVTSQVVVFEGPSDVEPVVNTIGGWKEVCEQPGIYLPAARNNAATEQLSPAALRLTVTRARTPVALSAPAALALAAAALWALGHAAPTAISGCHDMTVCNRVAVGGGDIALSDDALQRVLFFVALSEPVERWPAYSSVCRRWLLVSRRAYAEAVLELPRFSRSLSHRLIDLSPTGRAAVRADGAGGPQTSGPMSVVLRHDVRVGGGGYVGLLATPHPPATGFFGAPDFKEPKLAAPYALRALGTHSGSAVGVTSHSGKSVERLENTRRPLDGQSGWEYRIEYQHESDDVLFWVRQHKGAPEELVARASLGSRKVLQLSESDPASVVRLYFVVALFAPGTRFSVVC
eukprot:m51a1_g13782 hypothetical protein (640) ;mRNA; r:306518-312739